MRKTILLDLLNYDLRFDIVFALRFDHYPDLIPISIGKNIFRIRINRFKRARLEKRDQVSVQMCHISCCFSWVCFLLEETDFKSIFIYHSIGLSTKYVSHYLYSEKVHLRFLLKCPPACPLCIGHRSIRYSNCKFSGHAVLKYDGNNAESE